MRSILALSILVLAACSESAAHRAAAPNVVTAPAAMPGTTNPTSYEEWRLSRWRDESGNLPTVAQWRAARMQRSAVVAATGAIDDPNATRTSWVSRGPDNVGGRTRSLVIDPRRPYRMWAGSVGGGIWRSDTYGSNWQKLDDFMGNLAVCCIAIDPSNADVMYAGTGEGFGNADAISGEGIWKTTDSGTTWSLLTSTASFGNVNRIAIASGVLLAATSTGIWRSIDGGVAWVSALTGSSRQVLFDPNNSQRCVAHIQSGTSHQVWWSIDQGASWFVSTLLFVTGRIEMAYAPGTAGTLYAGFDVGGGQLWKSTDNGVSWTQLTATGLTGGSSPQVWYNDCLWVDPTNSNSLLVGWSDLFRSSDGGATFTQIGGGGGTDSDVSHSDHHAIVADARFDGVVNKTVYVCTDGGVYRMTDYSTATAAAGWSQRENGYVTTQAFGVAGHGSGRIIAGFQDNGTHAVTVADQHSTRLFGGDGGYCAIDPINPLLAYGEVQTRRLLRHNGTAETFINSGAPETGTGACTAFIAPLVMDPNERRRLYSGGCSLWRTDDATVTPPVWTAVMGSTGTAITAIAVAPSDSNIVWVGLNNGVLLKTANATAAAPTWTSVDDNNTRDPLPNRSINDILINRTNASEVYVCLGGFSAGNLQRTTNSGTTWSTVTGLGATALPNAPMFSIAQHPIQANTFYVGSEVGAFDTQDNCATWSTTNEGPADVSCNQLRFIPGTTTLLLGTHGRGIWTAELTVPGTRVVGVGCAGSNGTPTLSATSPRIGLTTTITCAGVVPNRPVLLLQGLSQWTWFGNRLPFDLAPFGAAGCKLNISPDIVREFAAGVSSTVTINMAIGPSPALVGQRFYLQAVVDDPAANSWGHTTSNAVEMTIGQ